MKIRSLLLLTVFVTMAVAAFFGIGAYLAYRDSLEKAFHAQTLNRSLQLQTYVLCAYDDNQFEFDKRTADAYRAMTYAQHYFADKGPDAPLEPLKTQLSRQFVQTRYEINIVDSENIVRRTTYRPDDGFDFSVFPGLATAFGKLRQDADSIDLSHLYFDPGSNSQKRYITQKMAHQPYLINISQSLPPAKTLHRFMASLLKKQNRIVNSEVFRLYDQRRERSPLRVERVWAVKYTGDISKNIHYGRHKGDRTAYFLDLLRQTGVMIYDDGTPLFPQVKNIFARHDYLENFYWDKGHYFHRLLIPINAYENIKDGTEDVLMLEFDETDALEKVHNYSMSLIAFWLLLVLLLVGGVVLLYRRIIQPMQVMRRSMSLQEHVDSRVFSNGKNELAEMAEDYNHLLDELEAKIENNHRLLRECKHFTSDTIHQVRTPISVIKIALEMIHTEDTEAVMQIRSSLVSIEHLYDSIAYYIHSGELVLSAEEIDLSEILRERIAQFDIVARANDMRINSAVDMQVFVTMNKTEAEYLIDNSLSNAIKYGENTHAIRVALAKREGTVILSFENHGKTIRDKEGIFKRYIREDMSRKGSGIGLSMIADICKRYGILIDVKSGEGKTVFSYYFDTDDMNVT